eukprot:4708926-Alexandrium_andersonii.AAC.1
MSSLGNETTKRARARTAAAWGWLVPRHNASVVVATSLGTLRCKDASYLKLRIVQTRSSEL